MAWAGLTSNNGHLPTIVRRIYSAMRTDTYLRKSLHFIKFTKHVGQIVWHICVLAWPNTVAWWMRRIMTVIIPAKSVSSATIAAGHPRGFWPGRKNTQILPYLVTQWPGQLRCWRYTYIYIYMHVTEGACCAVMWRSFMVYMYSVNGVSCADTVGFAVITLNFE